MALNSEKSNSGEYRLTERRGLVNQSGLQWLTESGEPPYAALFGTGDNEERDETKEDERCLWKRCAGWFSPV